jgi:hypothetical protein
VNAPVLYAPRLAGIGVYLFHGQFLSKSRTVGALSDLFGWSLRPPSGRLDHTDRGPGHQHEPGLSTPTQS